MEFWTLRTVSDGSEYSVKPLYFYYFYCLKLPYSSAFNTSPLALKLCSDQEIANAKTKIFFDVCRLFILFHVYSFSLLPLLALAVNGLKRQYRIQPPGGGTKEHEIYVGALFLQGWGAIASLVPLVPLLHVA